VELSIAWPALLHNIAPMQLVVSGRIVRAEGARAAVRMVQHEFRTAGSSSVETVANTKSRAASLPVSSGPVKLRAFQ
jgi:hypothetical protein